MKLRRVLSAATALAVAVSAAAVTTVTSSATTVPEGCNSAGMFACLLSDDSNVPLFTDSSLVATITSVSLTLKTKDKDFEAAVASGTEWYGGGFGFNSNSTGWDSHEWSIQDGVKELTLVATDTRYEYKISYESDTPIFAASDEYAQVWIQDWTSSATFEVVSFELLNADGVDIRTLASDTSADDTAADYTDDTAVEAPAEDTAEDDILDDETEEEYIDEDTEEYIEDEDTEDIVDDDTAEVVADGEDDTAASDDTAAAATDTKGNPDTGVAGVAVTVGVVALAGAAVIASRKRK